MKHNNSVLQLPFNLPDLNRTKAQVQQKITELEAKKAAVEATCKKLHPNHTKLFIHFEQQCLDKQIELLQWLIGEPEN